jgi:hypothetical protein
MTKAFLSALHIFRERWRVARACVRITEHTRVSEKACVVWGMR